jgi:CRP/FNR family transcriptional regulator
MKILSSEHHCTQCVMGLFCLPKGLSKEESDLIHLLVKKRLSLEKGDLLFSQGQKFHAIFSIRYGSLKSEFTLEDGRSQILNFHIAGDFIGLDGIVMNHYDSMATALEKTEVCLIDFARFEQLAQQVSSLQKHLHHIFSREISRDQKHLLSLGHLSAEQRLAFFLIHIIERLESQRQPYLEFELSMSREDIGNYLGMKIETVSRELTKLIKSRLLEVKSRHIKLINLQKLYQLAGKTMPPAFI